MIKQSKVYKVICSNMTDKYVLAANFSEAERIVNQYISNRKYNTTTIQCISDKGDILYEDNRTED